MKAGQIALFLVLGLLAVGIFGGGCVYQGYNQAIVLNEGVKNQWAQVENQLQRRYDLIPNLVATAKGYGQQEQKIMLGIANARRNYDSAKTVNEKATAAGQVEGALARLLVVVENYPQLKSNELFLKLQDSLEGTENRLSVERGNYNDTVKTLNSFVLTFPGRLYAWFAGVTEAKYFQVESEAKTAPKVDFSDKPSETKTEPAEPREPAEPATK